MVHGHWTAGESQKWLGTLYSPNGSGGNFKVTGTVDLHVAKGEWPKWALTESLNQYMKAPLKGWDHQFLNDLEWAFPVLTLEVLGNGLWDVVSQAALPEGVTWRSVSVDLGENIQVLADSSGHLETSLGFRFQSLIGKTDTAVDADLILKIDGRSFREKPSLSCTPIGDLQNWASESLAVQLQNQTVDQWLGATTIEAIPELMFPLLKQKFPSLKGLKLSSKGREITTSIQ